MHEKHLVQECQTLDEFVNGVYLPHIRLRKRSWHIDERISRKHLSAAFGHRKMRDITAPEIEDWQSRLLMSGFSPASANRFFSTLKTIFFLAESRGVIPFGEAPVRRLRQLKKLPVRERYLTAAEGRELLEKLSGFADIRARAIELILLTGARKNEILKARWEYVDYERHTLAVPVSKSGKSRFIVLSQAALKIIGSLPTESQWLFPGRNPEKPISDIFTFWNFIRKEMGFKDIRIHDLRHTFASWLVNEGHSLYEIQKLLGHADPRTTMRYAHLGISTLIQASETISGLLQANRKIKSGRSKIVGNQKMH